jgi:excisionase family DNA binding protein
MSIMTTGLSDTEKPTARRTYTVAEAAAQLGIGKNQGYEAARRGEIPTIRIGKRLLVPREALDRILNAEIA